MTSVSESNGLHPLRGLAPYLDACVTAMRERGGYASFESEDDPAEFSAVRDQVVKLFALCVPPALHQEAIARAERQLADEAASQAIRGRPKRVSTVFWDKETGRPYSVKNCGTETFWLDSPGGVAARAATRKGVAVAAAAAAAQEDGDDEDDSVVVANQEQPVYLDKTSGRHYSIHRGETYWIDDADDGDGDGDTAAAAASAAAGEDGGGDDDDGEEDANSHGGAASLAATLQVKTETGPTARVVDSVHFCPRSGRAYSVDTRSGKPFWLDERDDDDSGGAAAGGSGGGSSSTSNDSSRSGATPVGSVQFDEDTGRAYTVDPATGARRWLAKPSW